MRISASMMNILRLLLFIGLCTQAFSSRASLGKLLNIEEIPQAACLAEFKSGSETYHCSGALVDSQTFKTAAHCLKEDTDITIRCVSGEEFQVIEVIGHKKFNHKKIKRNLYERRYDHAFLSLDKPSKSSIPKTFVNKEEIHELLAQKRECAFFGVGLNPWYQGTGRMHGVKTSSSKVSIENGLIIINDPFSAVTMIGDSGASFFCKDEREWINIGTVSAHSWENETIVASNDITKEDHALRFNSLGIRSKLNELESDNLQEIEVAKTYRVLPFSEYHDGDIVLNTGDRQRARIEITSIDGNYVTGKLDHYGPADYYLCGDGISCEETLINIRIHKSNLTSNYQRPEFIDLR